MEKYEVTVLITITFNGNNDNQRFEEMFIFLKGQQLSDYYLVSHNHNSKYLYNILNLRINNSISFMSHYPIILRDTSKILFLFFK